MTNPIEQIRTALDKLIAESIDVAMCGKEHDISGLGAIAEARQALALLDQIMQWRSMDEYKSGKPALFYYPATIDGGHSSNDRPATFSVERWQIVNLASLCISPHPQERDDERNNTAAY